MKVRSGPANRTRKGNTMIGVHRRPLRFGAAVLTVGLLATGCGNSREATSKGQVASTTSTTISKAPDSTASQVRSRLNGLLVENGDLTGAATGAAAAGRSDELAGAVAALDGNSGALTDNVTAIFGAPTGKTFDGLWRKHVDAFVTYGQNRSPQAVSDLTQFTKDFGAFVNSALPSLSADTVTGLMATHVQDLKAVVDAQAGGNQSEAYSSLRTAAAQTVPITSALIGAIHQKNPDEIGGDPASKAADMANTLTVDLREAAFLTSAAADAIVGGRNDEFTGAKAAVDNNTAALADAFTGIYGADAGKAFAPLWTERTGYIVDYATAVAAKQQTNADAALNNLLKFSTDFGAFVNKNSPKLSAESAGALAMTHVFTEKDVIDAAAAKDFTKAYANERTAADHMSTVASTLAPLIFAQFPDKY
jgi:hypothetical protein